MPAPRLESFWVRPLEDAMKVQALRFIDSWSASDVYDRFGTSGMDLQRLLAFQITQRNRRCLIAVHAGKVVGLLDYVYADGAIHMGIVVDSRHRRRSIGTNLALSLLEIRDQRYPVVAECRSDNRAAIALLRRCGFDATNIEKSEMNWRVA